MRAELTHTQRQRQAEPQAPDGTVGDDEKSCTWRHCWMGAQTEPFLHLLTPESAGFATHLSTMKRQEAFNPLRTVALKMQGNN